MATANDDVSERVVKARSEMDRTSMSKYEFLQELHYAREVEGMEPEYLRGLKSKSAKIPADGKAKTWMTRRRRDGKVRKPYLQEDFG